MSSVLPQEAAPTRLKKKLSQNIFHYPNQDPKVDILLVNDTEIPLVLDVDQDCQRDCQCKGWQVEYSKEREGWQKRLFSDKVRQDCGGPRTSRRTSAVFERDFFSFVRTYVFCVLVLGTSPEKNTENLVDFCIFLHRSPTHRK